MEDIYSLSDINKVFKKIMNQWLITTWFTEDQKYEIDINVEEDWTDIFSMNKPRGTSKVTIEWTWEGMLIILFTTTGISTIIISLGEV